MSVKTLTTKKELRKILAERHNIRYSISQPMSREQLQALVSALETETPLGAAIRAIVTERNAKAKNNSRLGLDNHHLGNKLDSTYQQLSYVEHQLEKYQSLFRELMQDLLNIEKSEIYLAIRGILDNLK